MAQKEKKRYVSGFFLSLIFVALVAFQRWMTGSGAENGPQSPVFKLTHFHKRAFAARAPTFPDDSVYMPDPVNCVQEE